MSDATTPERLLVAIGLGSNVAPESTSPFDLDPPSDPRARALEGALLLLRTRGHRLRAASPLYETAPEGVPDAGAHGPFLNACILVETLVTPAQLLDDCETIERAAGRRTKGDGAPRPLDLDLLAAWRELDDRLVPVAPLSTERLTLPHPRLAERSFVLLPLVGVLADAPLLLPGEGPLTAWALLRRSARGMPASLRPGPPSASFPSRLDTATGGN